MARTSPPTEEFLNTLKAFIVSEHADALRSLRRAKIVTASHDSRSVQHIVNVLSDWLPTAPIPRTDRRNLHRHGQICVAFQELFTTIDQQTDALRLWEAGRDQATLAVLREVQVAGRSHLDAIVAFNANAAAQRGSTMYALEGHRALTRGFRDVCDAAIIVLRQVARRCTAGTTVPTDVEVNEAIELAKAYDLVQSLFDLYSYNGWQVLFRNGAIRLVPSVTDLDRARRWSATRIYSDDSLGGDRWRRRLRNLVARAEKSGVQPTMSLTGGDLRPRHLYTVS
jgi:hypothetical protein